ncbi:hypothetical protein [sulfur-oxidizing endosymbiont of Gigantopelta aegis]|uniref:hypothetical protein n=1 Tax=sulfur-oxidizing endosymbiont of Gigantopelta aegis TaxID=2794934 RepID=UPI0018DE8FD7|nr:hypothetical protein [sulfur-oxidizing endosymbiont of Gigantopelta aegis]
MNKVIEIQSKPTIRQAVVSDFEKVYPLLLKMKNSHLCKQDWQRLFQNHWSEEAFSPGIVLAVGEQIVGYIGTIYSHQKLAGKTRLFCNLSTWIVLHEYRSYSIMMLFPLLKNKDLILTSFSSNDVTYEIYKKLGFKDGNQSKRILYRSSFFQSNDYKIIVDVEEIGRSCNPANKVLFDDHASFGNAYALVKHKQEECLLMGGGGDGLFSLYSASDPQFLQQHLTFFRNQLMSQMRVKRIQIDEQLLNGTSLFLSRLVTWGYPYQYRSVADIEPPSPEYSEVFLLKM